MGYTLCQNAIKSLTANIIIIIDLFPHLTAVQLFSKHHGLTEQARLILHSVKTFLTVLLSALEYIYTAGRRLSTFKLSGNLFGITPVVDNTGGITYSYKLFFQGCIFL
jgi:hypothetical protein